MFFSVFFGRRLKEFSDIEVSSRVLFSNPVFLLFILVVVIGLYLDYKHFYVVDIPDPEELNRSKQEGSEDIGDN